MDQTTGSKTKSIYILGMIFIVLIIVVGFFWFFGMKNQDQKPAGTQQQQNETGFTVDTKYLGNNQILRGFPDNLPKEISGKILQNSESTTSDGRLQSTKKFTSRLSSQQALQKYADFFKGLGWKSNTSGSIQSPALFTKDQSMLMIVARTNATSKDTVVEITIIQRNATAAK